jgi:organic radical activating enzyme
MFEYYQAQGRKQFNLHITGGEPTLWPKLGDFIRRIKSHHKVYVSVVSNGSRTLRWWESYGKYIDNLTLSHHVRQANIAHTIYIADTMYRLGKKVSVHVLMDPIEWDKSVQTVDYMILHSKHRWFIQTKEIISVPKQQIDYTQEQREYLKNEIKRMPNILWFIKNVKLIIGGQIRPWESTAKMLNGNKIKAQSQTYITHGWTNFKGWSCNLGIEGIYIHWNGQIQGSCGQPLWNKNYNILDPNFNFTPNLKPVICQQSQCNCPPETQLSKVYFS